MPTPGQQAPPGGHFSQLSSLLCQAAAFQPHCSLLLFKPLPCHSLCGVPLLQRPHHPRSTPPLPCVQVFAHRHLLEPQLKQHPQPFPSPHPSRTLPAIQHCGEMLSSPPPDREIYEAGILLGSTPGPRMVPNTGGGSPRLWNGVRQKEEERRKSPECEIQGRLAPRGPRCLCPVRQLRSLPACLSK